MSYLLLGLELNVGCLSVVWWSVVGGLVAMNKLSSGVVSCQSSRGREGNIEMLTVACLRF